MALSDYFSFRTSPDYDRDGTERVINAYVQWEKENGRSHEGQQLGWSADGKKLEKMPFI